MSIFQKIFFVLAAAACAASCTFDDEQNYSASYPLDTTFEYQNAFAISDSLYFDKQIGQGIGWDQLAFYHKLDKDKASFKGGFILSRLKGSGRSDDDRFRVCLGAGMNTSNTYIVYYSNPKPSDMPEKDIEFINSKFGTCTMVGCFINNTREVLDAVNERFVDGDRLAVKMTGYLGGKETASQEFVLAEFTEAKDSIVTNWAPFKLDKLGQIDVIDVEIVSNRDDIPMAFCMDDMLAKITLAY